MKIDICFLVSRDGQQPMVASDYDSVWDCICSLVKNEELFPEDVGVREYMLDNLQDMNEGQVFPFVYNDKDHSEQVVVRVQRFRIR